MRVRSREANSCFISTIGTLGAYGWLVGSYVERLIGSVRREYLDRLFFWNTRDLQHKLDQFKDYFNEHRVHAGINGDLPNQRADEIEPRIASLENYSWDSHCNGLFQIPKAA